MGARGGVGVLYNGGGARYIVSSCGQKSDRVQDLERAISDPNSVGGLSDSALTSLQTCLSESVLTILSRHVADVNPESVPSSIAQCAPGVTTRHAPKVVG